LVRGIALLSETRNLTVLLVTPDPTGAAALCQFALVLDQGSLSESEPWKELLVAPQSELNVFRQQLQAPASVSEKA
jgi:ABC-type methionine transport system ATPase subunit